jgi:hypothetical protein
MWNGFDPMTMPQGYGASDQVRVLTFLLGVALIVWTWSMLRKRVLLISAGGIFTIVGFGLTGFAAFPAAFDSVAYAVGVKYPPVLYLIVILLGISGTLLHLASRVSALDDRCRRLTQEVAFLRSETEAARDGRVMVPRQND